MENFAYFCKISLCISVNHSELCLSKINMNYINIYFCFNKIVKNV